MLKYMKKYGDIVMIIVLDADGVLLDYNKKLAHVCEKALNIQLGVLKYFHHFSNAVNFQMTPVQSEKVFTLFDIEGWNSMPAIEGSVEACKAIAALGHSLVCVSSMPDKFVQARKHNLINLGIPINHVLGTGRDDSQTNPKSGYLKSINPDIFVDDQIRNFHGIPDSICKVWIDHGYTDCPNVGMDKSQVDFTFKSLRDFSFEFVKNSRQFNKI